LYKSLNPAAAAGRGKRNREFAFASSGIIGTSRNRQSLVGKTLAVEQGNEAVAYELTATNRENGVNIETCVPTQLISTFYSGFSA